MSFLKVLWNNLRQGPVTDPFPFGETYTPERLRGRVEMYRVRHMCACLHSGGHQYRP